MMFKFNPVKVTKANKAQSIQSLKGFNVAFDEKATCKELEILLNNARINAILANGDSIY